MSQPWGLSGPQFLVIYGVGTAVVLVVPFLLRLLIRFVSSADAGRQLDPCEVGYLAGGPTRAAQVVVTDFVASGAVRVDSSGRVTGADRAAIKARLRAEGLMVSSARAAMVLIVSLALWAALFVTGGLRLAEGAHNHRPTGDLQGLVVLSVFACLFSLLAIGSRLTNSTTFRGAGLLRRLRSAERDREREAARQGQRGAAVFSPGLPGGGFGFGAGMESAALFGVALAGFAAVTDESTRSALLAGLPSSSGGSSCGGGGGGCGGGGCGGGCGG